MKRNHRAKGGRWVGFLNEGGTPAPEGDPKPDDAKEGAGTPAPETKEKPAAAPAPEAKKDDKKEGEPTLAEIFKSVTELASGLTALKGEMAEIKNTKPTTPEAKPAGEKPEGEAKKEPAKEEATVSEAELNALKKRMDEMEKDKTAANARALRERMLREAGADLIPELVTADDEETIKTQIEASKNKFKELQEKFAPKADAAKGEGDPAPAAPAPTGAVPSATKPEAANVSELSLDAIQEMPIEKYAANRDEIKRAALKDFKYGD